MVDKEAPNKAKSKRRKIIEGIIYGVVGLLVVASLTISIITIYHNNKYTKFFVDGQSMYPTLNLNAKYPNGALIGQRRIGEAAGTYDVDYGFMDKSEAAIESIKRFDIVVCRFNNDDTDLIKRVLVLPGETFYFTTGPKDSAENGNLYIKGVGQSEFTLVEQPLTPEMIHSGYYTEKPQYSNTKTGYTLASNEYFVCGDNRPRNNSVDSRARDSGISRENMLGKVIGLEGTCRVIKDAAGNLKASDIKYYFPKRF